MSTWRKLKDDERPESGDVFIYGTDKFSEAGSCPVCSVGYISTDRTLGESRAEFEKENPGFDFTGSAWTQRPPK